VKPQSQAAAAADRAFALLQELLPQQLLSRGMYRLARSTRPAIKNAAIRLLRSAYPQIDLGEAEEPDPYRYPSFNAFFTRALRPGVRPLASGPDALVSPVDGTLSQFGEIDSGRMLQAKGIEYTAAALLGDAATAAQFAAGRYACIYLAPYDYHRIHVPLAARLRATRYLPGRLFSVNAATARTIPGLFGLNERVVCEFETRQGALALVMVGALFVGSIETVYAGEINPPPERGGEPRVIAVGEGLAFEKGAELGRFNMGSTVVVLWQGQPGPFAPELTVGARLRLGQLLAGSAAS
jgi:phosphatidylserine decarboxylase